MWHFLIFATWFLGDAFLKGQAQEFSNLFYEGSRARVFGCTFFS